MDDESAECLIRFAAAVADGGRAETVTLKAISGDGNVVEVTFLLNSATALAVESTTGDGAPPRNDDVVSWMRARLAAIANPPVALPVPPSFQSLEDTDTYT